MVFLNQLWKLPQDPDVGVDVGTVSAQIRSVPVASLYADWRLQWGGLGVKIPRM